MNGQGVYATQKKTYFYSADSGNWTNGPDLLKERDAFACGTIKDIDTGFRIVLAGAGFESMNVEQLNLDQNPTDPTWTVGPGLPVKGADGVVTKDATSLIVVGGENTNIYQISCFSNKCHYKTLEQKLKSTRNAAVALLIPDSFDMCWYL